MKKEVLLNKFIQYVGQCRSSYEYRTNAVRVITDLDRKNGGYVEDIVFEDFEGTGINEKRMQQILDRVKRGSILSASMIVDFLTHVGGKMIEELDKKNLYARKNRDYGTIAKQYTLAISQKCLKQIEEEAKRSNLPVTTFLENAINYYCDLDDSEK